jgi:hypothetical protein
LSISSAKSPLDGPSKPLFDFPLAHYQLCITLTISTFHTSGEPLFAFPIAHQLGNFTFAWSSEPRSGWTQHLGNLKLFVFQVNRCSPSQSPITSAISPLHDLVNRGLPGHSPITQHLGNLKF